MVSRVSTFLVFLTEPTPGLFEDTLVRSTQRPFRRRKDGIVRRRCMDDTRVPTTVQTNTTISTVTNHTEQTGRDMTSRSTERIESQDIEVGHMSEGGGEGFLEPFSETRVHRGWSLSKGTR